MNNVEETDFNMRPCLGRYLYLIGVWSLLVIVAYGQKPSSDKAPATISGRVTIDNKEAAGVVVMLKPDAGGRFSWGGEQPPALSASSDAEGRYRLNNIPPGSYRLSAFAPAYAVEGDNDPTRPGRIVNLAEGETIGDLDLSLLRGGVITGRVTDEEGRNVIAEPVRVHKIGSDGKPAPEHGFTSMFVHWETDDRGVYRIFGLEPGKYLVAVGGQTVMKISYVGGDGGGYYLRTYYPSAVTESEAKVVEVKGGEEAGEINIRIASPAEGFVASGRVVEAETGEPISGVRINCSPTKSTSDIRFLDAVVSNSLGEFRFERLPPNSYRAHILNTNGGDLFGDQVLFDIVDGDVNGLEIRRQREATISGVIILEGSNDPTLRAGLLQASVIAQNISDSRVTGLNPNAKAVTTPEGSFKLSSLTPGKTRIIQGLGAPKGISLSRIERNGVETTDFDVLAGEQITGVRLIFTHGAGVIAGRVEIKGGALPPHTRLMVRALREGETGFSFSTPSAEVDSRGQFLIEGLSHGLYRLTLYPGSFSQTGGNPINLRRVEKMITVADEGRHEITLTLDLTPKEDK